MASSMRALVKPGPGPGFLLTDVPVPSIGPTDVLINVEKAGVCGTDHHIYSWDSWAQAAHQAADRRRARVHGDRSGSRRRGALGARRRTRFGRRTHRRSHLPALPHRSRRTSANRSRSSASIATARLPSTSRCRSTTCGGSIRRFPTSWQPSSIRSATRCTPSWRPASASRASSITGVGSIGLMAIPVARAAGATAIFAIDVNPAKLELARAWVPTRRSWRRSPDLVDEIKAPHARRRRRRAARDVGKRRRDRHRSADGAQRWTRGAARHSVGQRQRSTWPSASSSRG